MSFSPLADHIYYLTEYDVILQGWHIEGNPLSLSNFKKEEVLKTVKTTAPYLARIFTILKQSAISLNCLSRPEGEHFVEHIRKVYKFNHINTISICLYVKSVT